MNPFHQVFSLFTAVPPVIQVACMAPELWRWLINLAWVRYITGRPAPRTADLKTMGTPNPTWRHREEEGMIDNQSSFVTEQPLLGGTRAIDQPDRTTEHGQYQLFTILPLFYSRPQFPLLHPYYCADLVDVLLGALPPRNDLLITSGQAP